MISHLFGCPPTSNTVPTHQYPMCLCLIYIIKKRRQMLVNFSSAGDEYINRTLLYFIKLGWSVCLYVHVCPSVCPCVFLICVHMCLSVCLSACVFYGIIIFLFVQFSGFFLFIVHLSFYVATKKIPWHLS